MILVPSGALHGSIPISFPIAISCTPYIFGMDGPVISASKIPAVYPFSIIIRAREAVTSDFPTPPFPLMTPITFFTWEPTFAGALDGAVLPAFCFWLSQEPRLLHQRLLLLLFLL